MAGPAPSWAVWASVPQFPHRLWGSSQPSPRHGVVGHRGCGVKRSRGGHPMGTGSQPPTPGDMGRSQRCPGFTLEHATSCLAPMEKCHRQSYPKSPFVPRFVTPLSPSPSRGWVWIRPPHLPLQRERRWLGGAMVGSHSTSSAAFGDHLPVPLLLLHQPGGEQGDGLRDPPERDLLKPRGGDTHLRLRTSVSSMSRSWAARSSSRRCW